MSKAQKKAEGIAIVGMAGRFPKARNVDELWRNLCAGVEGISFFTDEELTAAGVDFPKANPNYVKARGVLEDADLFDAAFFGMNPKEAEITDPQHRVFLECAWEALEDAGCDPERFDGAIGVFAGMSMNTYLAANLRGHAALMASLNPHQIMLANDKDFLPTRASYKLNLRGPSLNIQTACSTSLVAVCVACQSLLDFQCDLALAGAAAVSFPQKQGHFFQEGGIGSPDGHCRAFDARAAGTVAGEGVAIVALKRLEAALADGDEIYAVIKGFALNNDGSNKVGYTAPSVEGQAEVIAMAQAMASIAPETISYVEAHGTGTPLGDPIEIEGLTKAFRAGTEGKNFCAVGSVKSNIGHLDTAAGVAGLMKTALALHHKKIPPTLHFESPNPKIDFASSPFYVNAKLAEWKNGATPRRAGVSSFGIGGTNAHVVLEEAPAVNASGNSRPAQLLLLSAKTEAALDRAAANLAEHLKQNAGLNLADVAHTLQVGRRGFAHRRMLVCRDANEAAEALKSRDPKRVFAHAVEHENPPVVFMFPGQGAQQVNMARELYEGEPFFREQVDLCCENLKLHFRADLRSVLYPEAEKNEEAKRQLTQTAITQPALFVIEYALAKLWMSWGVRPEAMIGHSLGEYVAACLAGVFSLEDALKLVAARGRMMQQLPGGTMLAVRLPEREVEKLLNDELSLATVNGAALCVVSGRANAIENLQKQLAGRDVACTPLQTSHAFHSAMMGPILAPFTELFQDVKCNAPQIPFISNVTGTWITAGQATDPAYWAQHLRKTVRFADGVGELLKSPERVFLEVGPGQTLTGLTRQHPARNPKTLTLPSLPRAKDESSEVEAAITALGQLWLAGVVVDWKGFYQREQRRCVRLPKYPFERKRYFVEPVRAKVAENFVSGRTSKAAERNGFVEEHDLEIVRAAAPVGVSATRPFNPSATRKQHIAATLRTLLGDLSGADLADMSDNATFTELGFESLFLTQASLAIEKKLGVRVAFRELLQEFSTLDALAAHIDEALPKDESQPDVSAVTDRRYSESSVRGEPVDTVTIPLTDAQRELWFGSQMSDAASCAFNECRLIHLRGPLQADALRAALQQLVGRHEGLRTTFAPAGDSQQVHPSMKMEAPLVDWSKLETQEHAARFDAVQIEEARQPFDLVNGPLLRARLIRLGEQHHLLMLTIHHIICDGHSLGVVLRELSLLYCARCHGAPLALPKAAQLSEYVRVLEARRESAEHAADEAWWLKQFADGAPALELPTDNPRSSVWTFEGAREGLSLPASLGRDLKRLGAQHHGTLFTTLLASYLLLLRRLTGQNDIVVGIPTADRTMEGGDALVGHCLNFLPLRGKLRDDQTFAEHLASVQKLFLDAYDHQRYTFGSLIQKLDLLRDPSRMPLVSVTFNVERLNDAPKFFQLETGLAANMHSFTNFDFSLNVTEINGALQLDCRFNSSLFSAETIRRWLGHFQTLLEGVTANPQQKISGRSLLTDAERRQILIEWNNTHANHQSGKCVHELFEEQAGRTPDAVAVVFKEKSLTYRELNEQAEQLARRLNLLEVGPDVPVGICADRSLELLVGVLAILKAGGAYVPLDPAYPRERLALMLNNTRAPVLLTQEHLAAKLPGSKTKVICLDAFFRTGGVTARDVLPRPTATPDHLAYIIHTSGSTGVPKSVAIEHRQAVNFVHWAQGVFTQEELAGVLFSTSLCFDLSVFELFVTLSRGGKVIVAQNAIDLPNVPAKDEVTLLNTVPSAAAELLRLNAIPPSVRVINLAGEPLKASLADRLYSLGTVKKVYDLYGPSETTTYSTCALRRSGGPATIGRPIANTQLYLLDVNRQPVPIGVIGEIYIGGEGVARGYLHRPDLTAERFLPNSFTSEAGARLYQTGDLARWLPDGNLELLGRADHQVKIRGYRVELGEIESALAQHPAVRECAVIAREDKPGDQRLAAYVAQEPDKAAASAGGLRRFLEEKLPDYMVPAAFVLLEALPLTPSGKVDRRALPAPDPARPRLDEAFAAPSTPTEEALAKIWNEVLGLEEVGMRDNFFELGGHSLLMTQVISRVRDAFQVELPMRRFFETPDIASLAAAIEEMLVEEIDQLSEGEARSLAQTTG